MPYTLHREDEEYYVPLPFQELIYPNVDSVELRTQQAGFPILTIPASHAQSIYENNNAAQRGQGTCMVIETSYQTIDRDIQGVVAFKL